MTLVFLATADRLDLLALSFEVIQGVTINDESCSGRRVASAGLPLLPQHSSDSHCVDRRQLRSHRVRQGVKLNSSLINCTHLLVTGRELLVEVLFGLCSLHLVLL